MSVPDVLLRAVQRTTRESRVQGPEGMGRKKPLQECLPVEPFTRSLDLVVEVERDTLGYWDNRRLLRDTSNLC